MDLQRYTWNGWESTKQLAFLYGFSKRHMARLLKDWEKRGTVKHMKAFYFDDYRIFDMWKSESAETIRRITEDEQKTKKTD